MVQSLRNDLRAVRRRLRALVGRDLVVEAELDCLHERFGSDYGGWDVAVGGLGADSVVYAAGVGEDISFDLALIWRFGLVVHAFDPTPKSIAWVKAQDLPAGFVLHEHGLADFDGDALFYPPVDPAHVSHTILERPLDRGGVVVAPMKRLRTVVAGLGHGRIDVLKIDIEGAEYGVIEDLAGGDLRPGQILVEFHHRFPGIGASRTHAAISRLRGIGYRVFSVSPTGEEFCFLYQPGLIAV